MVAIPGPPVSGLPPTAPRTAAPTAAAQLVQQVQHNTMNIAAGIAPTEAIGMMQQAAQAGHHLGQREAMALVDQRLQFLSAHATEERAQLMRTANAAFERYKAEWQQTTHSEVNKAKSHADQVFGATVAAYEARMIAMNEYTSQLEQRNTESAAQAQRLADQGEQLSIQVRQLTQQRESIRVTAHSHEIAWSHEKQDLQDRLDVAEVNRDNASAELSVSRDAVAVLKSDLEAARASMEEMWTKQAVLTAAKKAEEQYNAKLIKKNSQIDQLRLQMVAMKQNVPPPVDPVRTAGRDDVESDALQRANAELRTEVLGLKVKLAQVSVDPVRTAEPAAAEPEADPLAKCPECPKHLRKIGKLEKTISVLQEAQAALQTEHSDLQQEFDKCEASDMQAKAALAAKERELTRLTTKHKTLQQQYDERDDKYTADWEEICEEIEMLKARLENQEFEGSQGEWYEGEEEEEEYEEDEASDVGTNWCSEVDFSRSPSRPPPEPEDEPKQRSRSGASPKRVAPGSVNTASGNTRGRSPPPPSVPPVPGAVDSARAAAPGQAGGGGGGGGDDGGPPSASTSRWKRRHRRQSRHAASVPAGEGHR